MCALLERGEVECWGETASAELGYGRSYRGDVTPSGKKIDFRGLKVEQIKTSPKSTCALLEGGSVQCWGYNRHGELGLGHFSMTYEPTKSVELYGAKATQLSMGEGFACVVLESGAVKCWGSNAYGQLGLGIAHQPVYRLSSPSKENVDLQGGTAKGVSANLHHVCVVLQGGWVKCWGRNTSGQLGDANLHPKTKPDRQPLDLGGARVKTVHCGKYHTCVLLEDESVRCWGNNRHAQLGHGYHQPLLRSLTEPATY
ncbi:MAG: hypothetical protein AAGJ35_04705 [Myxococcota bacterium]